jgi:hypothetical protein
MLRELARVLELDYDTLLASAGAADAVVRENLQSHPEAEVAVIKLFRAAQARGFEAWGHLWQQGQLIAPCGRFEREA